MVTRIPKQLEGKFDSKPSFLIAIIITIFIAGQASVVQAVSRGQIEVGSKFVIALVKDGNPIPACSGALISEDIVVTAAHCVYKTKYIEEPSGLTITYPGSVVNTSSSLKLLEVSKVLPVPTFVGVTNIPYSYDVDDIAFIFLKEPILGFEKIKVADSTLVNRIKAEEYEIKHYGYGLQKEKPYTLDGNPYSVVLRATNNPVSAKSITAKDERVLYSKGTIPGFATCGGDSGGPGYVTVSGVTYLTSVISGAGGCDSSTYLGHTFSTLIFPHLEFLETEYRLYTEAKAAEELKAKQEAETKSAAELKAKMEAEAKAAAEKLIAEARVQAQKIISDAEAAASSATKKTTIICVKGKVTKKVAAVKPKCPKGFKKK